MEPFPCQFVRISGFYSNQFLCAILGEMFCCPVWRPLYARSTLPETLDKIDDRKNPKGIPQNGMVKSDPVRLHGIAPQPSLSPASDKISRRNPRPWNYCHADDSVSAKWQFSLEMFLFVFVASDLRPLCRILSLCLLYDAAQNKGLAFFYLLSQ